MPFMIDASIASLRKQLKNLSRDYNNAWSLTGRFYTDQDWFRFEREALFQRQWVCLGREESLLRSGDYRAVEVAGEPVLLVRGKDGVLRALSNVCRHRGAVIAEGEGNAEQFRCPYHHWRYELTGQLVSAPRLSKHGSFDAANCQLPEFPLQCWMGFVFVCLNQSTDSFANRVDHATSLVASYHLEQMSLKHVRDEIWPINWKCVMENYMEGYHLSPLHRTTLHKVNPTRLCRHIVPGDHHFAYAVGFTERLPEGHVGHPELSREELESCIMLAVPPSFAVGIGSDYSSFICLDPLGPDATRISMGLIFFGESWSDAILNEAIELFDRTMEEDKAVLLGVQRGLGSAFHQPGPLAPKDFEGTVVDLIRYLDRMLPDD